MKDFTRIALVAIVVMLGYIVVVPSVTHAAFSGCSAQITANVGAVRCLNTTDPADRYSARATCRTALVGGIFKGYADGPWVAAPNYSTARCDPRYVVTSVQRREIDW